MQTNARTGWLLMGDFVAALGVSIAGYLTHLGDQPFGWRWLLTFLPLVVGWGLGALAAGLFSPQVSSHPTRAIWHALLAGVLAAPFATMLRGLAMGAPVSPVFMLVLTLVTALVFALWRAVWAAWLSRVGRDG
jgi:hypothetical protein